MSDVTHLPHRATAAAALLSLALLATGCLSRSPEPRTFTLGATPPLASVDRASDVSVSLGPLRFPRYLERPQFVSRVAGGELKLDERHRWADSFEEDVQRALRLDLGQRLDTNRVIDHNQETWFGHEYSARVDFDEFVVGPDDVLHLRARWTVTGAGPDGPSTGRTDLDVPLRSSSIEDRVTAHEKAIAALGTARAGEVSRLQGARPDPEDG